MTTDEKLAAIEKRFAGYGAITYYETAWLIAEVRRLQAEYARGREDERRDVLACHKNFGYFTAICRIERGEHVAGKVIPIYAPPELIAAGQRVAERLAKERGEHLEGNDVLE